jgi:hypothetical protein
MDPAEVKQAHAQVGKITSASEGLRILARMIACRLMEKTCVNGQHPHSTLPSGGDDKKNTLQSPGMDDRKQAATSPGCSGLDIAEALREEEGKDG